MRTPAGPSLRESTSRRIAGSRPAPVPCGRETTTVHRPPLSTKRQLSLTASALPSRLRGSSNLPDARITSVSVLGLWEADGRRVSESMPASFARQRPSRLRRSSRPFCPSPAGTMNSMRFAPGRTASSASCNRYRPQPRPSSRAPHDDPLTRTSRVGAASRLSDGRHSTTSTRYPPRMVSTSRAACRPMIHGSVVAPPDHPSPTSRGAGPIVIAPEGRRRKSITGSKAAKRSGESWRRSGRGSGGWRRWWMRSTAATVAKRRTRRSGRGRVSDRRTVTGPGSGASSGSEWPRGIRPLANPSFRPRHPAS